MGLFLKAVAPTVFSMNVYATALSISVESSDFLLTLYKCFLWGFGLSFSNCWSVWMYGTFFDIAIFFLSGIIIMYIMINSEKNLV